MDEDLYPSHVFWLSIEFWVYIFFSSEFWRLCCVVLCCCWGTWGLSLPFSPSPMAFVFSLFHPLFYSKSLMCLDGAYFLVAVTAHHKGMHRPFGWGGASGCEYVEVLSCGGSGFSESRSVGVLSARPWGQRDRGEPRWFLWRRSLGRFLFVTLCPRFPVTLGFPRLCFPPMNVAHVPLPGWTVSCRMGWGRSWVLTTLLKDRPVPCGQPCAPLCPLTLWFRPESQELEESSLLAVGVPPSGPKLWPPRPCPWLVFI